MFVSFMSKRCPEIDPIDFRTDSLSIKCVTYKSATRGKGPLHEFHRLEIAGRGGGEDYIFFFEEKGFTKGQYEKVAASIRALVRDLEQFIFIDEQFEMVAES